MLTGGPGYSRVENIEIAKDLNWVSDKLRLPTERTRDTSGRSYRSSKIANSQPELLDERVEEAIQAHEKAVNGNNEAIHRNLKIHRFPQPGLIVIYIKSRREVLFRLISSQLARRTRQWHTVFTSVMHTYIFHSFHRHHQNSGNVPALPPSTIFRSSIGRYQNISDSLHSQSLNCRKRKKTNKCMRIACRNANPYIPVHNESEKRPHAINNNR